MKTAAAWCALAVTMLGIAPCLLHPAAADGPQAAPAPATAIEFPGSPAGRLAKDWMEALNDGSEPVLRKFFTERVHPDALKERPVEPRLAMAARVHADLGAMRLARVIESEPHRVKLLFAGGTGQWLELELECEAVPPHRMLGIGLGLVDAPEPEDGTSPDAAGLPDAIRKRVADLAAEGKFSGAVLVVRGGRVIHRGAVGEANRRTSSPNRANTRFNLGSINKMMTKLAIAQLAEGGRLSLDDVVSKHLPDLPRSWADRVTIAQLLDHRSGLGDYFGPRFDAADKSRIRSLRDYLPFFVSEPLEFEPGARERYSNAGYVVLGLVVEKLSGRSYYDYVQEWIFGPAGMTASGWPTADGPQDGIAMGYTRGDGDGPSDPADALHDNLGSRPGRGSSAGGGYATVDDLLRLVHAIRDGRLLGPRWNTWFASGRLPATAPADSKLERGGLGIAGGAPGINAAIEADFGRDDCVIVLANLDPPAAESLARSLWRWVAAAK